MSKLITVDNSRKDYSHKDYKSDLPNLRLIANKTIGDLQAESGILVFPPKVEETDDRIKDSVIFNLKEGEEFFSLETGNIMGFIGRNDTELNICSRFTHRVKDEKGNDIISEKNDFFENLISYSQAEEAARIAEEEKQKAEQLERERIEAENFKRYQEEARKREIEKTKIIFGCAIAVLVIGIILHFVRKEAMKYLK